MGGADPIGGCTGVGARVLATQIGESQAGATGAVRTAQDFPAATWALQNRLSVTVIQLLVCGVLLTFSKNLLHYPYPYSTVLKKFLVCFRLLPKTGPIHLKMKYRTTLNVSYTLVGFAVQYVTDDAVEKL